MTTTTPPTPTEPRVLRRPLISAATTAAVLLLAATGCATPRTAQRPAPNGALTAIRADAAAPEQPTPRQIVRRGDMAVLVERVPDARARLERSLGALGGQIAHFDAHEDKSADYALRVPADRLGAMMDSVATLGEVRARTISAEDVTDQVIDVEARLGALRASRDRLRQLLDRSASVPDVVSVERELARVQGEVESLEGRLAALRSQVALSELSVHLTRKPILGPVSRVLVGVGQLIGKLFIIG
jgi:hypothetical protein